MYLSENVSWNPLILTWTSVYWAKYHTWWEGLGKFLLKRPGWYQVSCPLTISYKRTSITSNYYPPLGSKNPKLTIIIAIDDSKCKIWNSSLSSSQSLRLWRDISYFVLYWYNSVSTMDRCSRFTFFYRTICRKFVYWPLRYDHSTR